MSTYLRLGGGYHLIERIGAGSCGEVWRAEAPGGIEVALKIIGRPLDHRESQREMQALELIRRLRHPFLLQTQAYWPQDDRLYIVMDLAESNLRERLQKWQQEHKTGLPPEELVRYLREAAEALDFLHRHHIQHRDVKPDNLLVLQGHMQVADFGLACVWQSRRIVNATGCGTPLYMAPEVWRGNVSPHSDQYSLAMTYAELRLNRRVFASREMVEVMFDHLSRTPDLEPLADNEQRVLRMAMSKEPDQRYASCSAFVRALEEVLERKSAPGIIGDFRAAAHNLPRDAAPRSMDDRPDDGFATVQPFGPSVEAGKGKHGIEEVSQDERDPHPLAANESLARRGNTSRSPQSTRSSSRPSLGTTVLLLLLIALVCFGAWLWFRQGLVTRERAVGSASTVEEGKPITIRLDVSVERKK